MGNPAYMTVYSGAVSVMQNGEVQQGALAPCDGLPFSSNSLTVSGAAGTSLAFRRPLEGDLAEEASLALQPLIMAQSELISRFPGWSLLEGSELTVPLLIRSACLPDCGIRTINELAVNAFLLRGPEELGPEHYRILAAENPWLAALFERQEAKGLPISGDLELEAALGEESICLDGTPAGARLRSNAYEYIVTHLREELDRSSSLIGPETIEIFEKREQLQQAELSLARSRELEHLADFTARLASLSSNIGSAVFDQMGFSGAFFKLEGEVRTELADCRLKESPLAENYEVLLDRLEELKINAWTAAAQHLLQRSNYESLPEESRGWAEYSALK